MAKLDELIVNIDKHNANLVLVQETWLDASVKNPILPNFVVVSRRDRSCKPNRGGVIIYASRDLDNVMSWKESEEAERLWLLVQRDSGCIAVCNWYLPPGNNLREIATFKKKWKK